MAGWRSRLGFPLVFAALGAATFAVAAAGTTVFIARKVLTPPRRRDEDVQVKAVSPDASVITLSVTPDTLLRGDYSFWFNHDAGHARIGAILSRSGVSVTRRVERVSFGDLTRAKRGRISGWWYVRPEELGLPVKSVGIETDGGVAPAWRFNAPKGDDGEKSTKWAIHVHGRGTQRQECLRAVPTFREHGWTSLVISYRNDGDGPRSDDGRYGLGSTEWRDVEAAIEYAVDHGATDIVLMGWSMGGAIVLQAATRSMHAGLIRGVVLESPVIDWVDTLRYQAGALHMPDPITESALKLLDAPWGGRLTGQSAPIGLPELDFVRRADVLTTPILLLHSDDDGYVPAYASRALAARRPDIVTFVRFTRARHTKLWNFDPKKWTKAISKWLDALEAGELDEDAEGATRPSA
ncbi:alpha/beta hydrolase family protein [Gryllotalpicola ginsengisoli]|uniref:alpha/beta hydrolase family protein n=1 Tax=Gryllotalpicola ginsengisoli TaxID=444608 RepID=UPI000412E25D|nr:alpha/beta fold hydrolase [Gryllotalpicola ginsengisoli]